ncbi:hypothetical protein AB1N83_001842 [Pleurotus pulmonarius]
MPDPSFPRLVEKSCCHVSCSFVDSQISMADLGQCDTPRPVKKKKRNQHKPIPSEDDLWPIVKYYWSLGFNDKDIAQHSIDHFDQSEYGLSDTSVKRLRKRWGLKGTRQQKHTFETLAPFIQEIRARFPSMGARSMVSALRLDYGVKAAEKSVREYLLLTEPAAVSARKRYQWKRRVFWCAGVNDLIVLDQHDKWKRFELYIHAGLDPFSGYVHWLKVWWTNRNPILITSYYLDAVTQQQGIPLLTQSDCGGENNGVANCHTWIRHQLDPSLRNTLQHRWKYKTHNIKSEAFYSYFRRRFAPGFEAILDYGVRSSLLDLADPLERMLFRWMAIPWIQRELDVWADRFNMTPRRQDKRKVLPCGIPVVIRDKPHIYGAKDYKVDTPLELLNDARQQSYLC